MSSIIVRLISLVTVLCLFLTISACNGNGTGEVSRPVSSKTDTSSSDKVESSVDETASDVSQEDSTESEEDNVFNPDTSKDENDTELEEDTTNNSNISNVEEESYNSGTPTEESNTETKTDTTSKPTATTEGVEKEPEPDDTDTSNTSKEETQEKPELENTYIPDVSQGEINQKTVNLFVNGKADFIIVRGTSASDAIIDATNTFRKAIAKKSIKADFKLDKVATNTEKIELLIGETNRKESAEALKLLKENRDPSTFDFIIYYSNRKMCIVAGSDDIMVDALSQFEKDFLSNKQIAFTENYTAIYTNNRAISRPTVNGVELKKFVIVKQAYNMSYLAGKQISNLAEDIYYHTAYPMNVVSDKTSEADYEIIIGDSSRTGTKKPSGANWEIIVSGKKVYINGGNVYALSAAIEAFGEQIKNSGDIKSQKGVATTKTSEGYSLTWADEFNGTKLNTKVWSFVKKNGGAACTEGWTMQFVEDSSLAYVKDGNLTLLAAKDDETKTYKAVELHSMLGMWYRYGYIEISCRIPRSPGFGPAFWSKGTHPEIWPEIDYMEYFGTDGQIKGTLLGWAGSEIFTHGWTDGEFYTNKFKREDTYFQMPAGENLYDEYHTIGFEWDEYSAVWSIDGVEYARCDELATYSEKMNATFHQNMYLLFSMQTGHKSNIRLPVDETTNWEENDFVIDYVRVYQKPGQILDAK